MFTAFLKAESAIMSSATFQPTLSSLTTFTALYPCAFSAARRFSDQVLLCPFSLRPPR